MTVIAWDGKYLAADRRANSGERITSVRKVHKITSVDEVEMLVAYAGDLCVGAECLEWL